MSAIYEDVLPDLDQSRYLNSVYYMSTKLVP